MPEIRHGSVVRKEPSLLRKDAIQKSSPSSNGTQRPSVTYIEKPTAIPPPGEEQEPARDLPIQKPGLEPVPTHLERSETPDSLQSHIQHNAPGYVSPLPVISSAEITSSQPDLDGNPFEPVNSRKFSNAIEGLEELVQEAVEAAEDTQDQEQVKELYDIIEGATNAIQRASVAPARHLMATCSPLEVSGSSEERFLVAPVQKTVHEDLNIARPVSDQQRGSATIDWADQNVKNMAETLPTPGQNFERSDSAVRGRSGVSSPRDLQLLPPQPIQPAARDHVDFVHRPSVARAHSRGRSRRRKGSGSDPEGMRHRHRRSFQSSDDSSSHSSRSRRNRSSSYGRTGPFDEEDIPIRRHLSSELRRDRNPLSVRDQAHHHHTFSLHRSPRKQPISRNWSTGKKRISATIACINTALLGIIVGIYAGEVPRIQYMLADERHHVIVGNVVLYVGLAISTFVSWPLPLLHGRKPYILASLALALPLQFPQAIVVGSKRSPADARFRTGLLVARAFSGLVLGFANVNFVTVLLDLFGASLQSKNPHQEFVVASDIRRHGGGMGLWLGIWSWCSIGSIALGFQIGAGIIESLTPDWGFYVVVMILVFALILNILAPETRRSAYRKSVTEVYSRDEQFITRRVARGEAKLHISTEGPKYWFEEVWAGLKLTVMMCSQAGFLILALYLGWIYAQIVLVIVLLGALLSRDYKWTPPHVGLGVLSIAVGALAAVPLTKAGIFSRERKNPFRTDSLTFQKQVSWSSHLIRRVTFTLTLPLMGLAYTVSSAGVPKPYMVPIVFAGAVGFLSILAIAECHGLIMETFDTCDLQPGVNTRHRLQSLAIQDKRRRTNYSSFPRVCAGIFASQTLAFIGAAVATIVGGVMTRHIGAQASTGVTAGILFGLTILLTAVLWRFKEIQVIPNHTFGTRRDTKAWEDFKQLEKGKSDWKAVVIGNPSGKMRKMSVLELGRLSRWTEIRKLNFLIRDEDAEKKRKNWSRNGGLS
ncbi:hypothetical protein K504DRAFT_369145 [Pleomassaria siparia CBS 279.74]|uniref:MFS general substrate transporter n=1 Tax=Pleomassaria siparia CBS 279.74 TaxID=1314801 RepID=A0A6G1KLF4_9PLEO|nr:hypothetical protein K504DRAFT_369145 [Pleomassaria siparia CBS 279.74]